MRYLGFPLALAFYILFLIPMIPLTIIAIIFSPVICKFMDAETGQLPKWLRWFQPVDTIAGCYDQMWIEEHPTWTKLKCAWTFIQRNPAYGACFSTFGKCGVDTITIGNRNISDGDGIAGFYLLIASNGVFQFKALYKKWSIQSIILSWIAFAIFVIPAFFLFGLYTALGLLLALALYYVSIPSTSCSIHEAGWQIHDPKHPTFGSYLLAPIRSYKFGKK